MKNVFGFILSNTKSMVFIDQAVFSGNSFITTILLVRILTPIDFGIYASIILMVYLLVSLLSAIVIQPLQVTIVKIANKNAYVLFSFLIQLSLVMFFLLIIWTLLKLNLSVFNMYNNLTSGILIFISGFVVHDYFRKLFLANGKIKSALAIDLIIAVFHISILCAALFSVKTTLLKMLFYLGLGYIPAFILGIKLLELKIERIAEWKLYVSTHYHQSKWLVMTAFVQWWSSNLFVVASGVFLGLKALGAFRFVQSLFGIFNVVLQIFENYVIPKVSRILIFSHSEAKNYINQIGAKSLIAFGFVLLPVFIFSKFIIVFVGGQAYEEYAYVVRGMTILYFFIFLGYPTRIAIRALVLNKNFFIGYVITLLFSLSTFNYLLKEWNLIGVIIGLVISQVILLMYWQVILTNKNFLLWK